MSFKTLRNKTLSYSFNLERAKLASLDLREQKLIKDWITKKLKLD